MKSLPNALIAIFLITIITLFTRAFPFIFYSKRRPPEIIDFIEKYIPPMVMVILVIYCLKDVIWTAAPFGLPELLAILLVAGLHLWRGNPLISIFGGTFFYMAVKQRHIIESLLNSFMH